MKKNIFANYAGMSALVLAPILALPWYLSELGTKQFGLVAFITMLQAILGLVDAGMSQALVREVAVRVDRTYQGRYRTAMLLFGFERVYWAFSICMALLVAFFSDVITEHWLNLEDLPAAIGQQAVYGAAAIFAVQFPGSIYRSLMIGAQAQVKLNGIMASGVILRHAGGVAAVIFWPSLSAYLAWHIATTLIETLFRRHFSWGLLRVRRTELHWNSKELRPAWTVVVGISGATLLGALTVQMDKIILSRMVSIEEFGYYTIAATVALGSLQLVYPLLQAALPQAIQLRNDRDALRRFSLKLAAAIFLLVALGFFIFSIFGKWLLQAWIGNADLVSAVYLPTSILLAGSALNAFYNIGYTNWIAHQQTARILQVNCLSLAIATTSIPIFVAWKGMTGAAVGWLAINLVGLIASLGWLRRK